MCALPASAVEVGCPSPASPVASLATTGFVESGSCLESEGHQGSGGARSQPSLLAVMLGFAVFGRNLDPRPDRPFGEFVPCPRRFLSRTMRHICVRGNPASTWSNAVFAQVGAGAKFVELFSTFYVSAGRHECDASWGESGEPYRQRRFTRPPAYQQPPWRGLNLIASPSERASALR